MSTKAMILYLCRTLVTRTVTFLLPIDLNLIQPHVHFSHGLNLSSRMCTNELKNQFHFERNFHLVRSGRKDVTAKPGLVFCCTEVTFFPVFVGENFFFRHKCSQAAKSMTNEKNPSLLFYSNVKR